MRYLGNVFHIFKMIRVVLNVSSQVPLGVVVNSNIDAIG